MLHCLSYSWHPDGVHENPKNTHLTIKYPPTVSEIALFNPTSTVSASRHSPVFLSILVPPKPWVTA